MACLKRHMVYIHIRILIAVLIAMIQVGAYLTQTVPRLIAMIRLLQEK